MTKLFYTGSIHTSRQVKTLWAIGKVSNTPDEIGSPQDLLKKDIAKIDSLELTSVGKADMLIRLARGQSVSDQFDSTKRNTTKVPDNELISVIAGSIELSPGQNSRAIVETIQGMDTGKKMEKANQYKNIKEETPKDLSFPM